MPSITLIHGSAQNAAGWGRVAEALRGRGYDVRTPELPKKEPAWTLRDYADFIGNTDVAVAASFSGVLLPLVECKARVFLAAVVPEPRRSIREQLTADPTMLPPEWIGIAAAWRDPANREGLARRFLFHDCDEQTIQWALPTLDLLDTSALAGEPNPFDTWPEGPYLSIIPTGDRTISPAWMRARSEAIGAEIVELDAGHCPHVSCSDEVAAIIDRYSSKLRFK